MFSRNRLSLAVTTAAVLSTTASLSQAQEIRFNFEATIIDYSADVENFINIDDGLISGYFSYDLSAAPVYQDEVFTDFDLFGSGATLFIDQIGETVDLEFFSYLNPETPEQTITDAFFQSGPVMLNDLDMSLSMSFMSEGHFLEAQPESLPDTVSIDFQPELLIGDLFINNYIYDPDNGIEEGIFLDFTVFERAVDDGGTGGGSGPGVDENGHFILGSQQPEQFVLQEGDPDLETLKTVVGERRTSRFEQSGGRHVTESFRVGGDSDIPADGDGEYLLSGGYLESTGDTRIGSWGTGRFTQTGGTHKSSFFVVGSVGSTGSEEHERGPSATGIGTYNLQGGLLQASSAQIGSFGQGTFNHSAGTFETAYLNVGGGASRVEPGNYPTAPGREVFGAYYLSGGSLDVTYRTVIGRATSSSSYVLGGTGTFYQSGGIHNTRNLIIGEAGETGHGEGRYELSNGELNVSENMEIGVKSADDNRARATRGQFLQTGGTTTVDGNVLIGAGSESTPNSLSIQAGQLSANQIVVGAGIEDQGSALLDINGSGVVIADVVIQETGTLKGDGGTVIGNVTLAGGKLAPGQSPGTLNIDGDLVLNSGVLELEFDGPGEQDLINVSGDTTFGENLTVQLLISFVPTEVLSIESFFGQGATLLLAGGFDPLNNIELLFTSDSGIQNGDTVDFSLAGQIYQYTHVVTDVPLPAAGWLFLTACAGLLSRARRA